MIEKFLNIFWRSTDHFEGQEEGEKVVLLLRRHSFVLVTRLSFLFLAALAPIFVWLSFAAELKAIGSMSAFLFIASLWYLALWILAFYFLTMFCLNTVIITDHRIIESEQHGFFDRKISELHAYRVQDVTVHTNGLIETLLSFGDIVVQTAASEKQFVFHRIANPEEVKDIIMRVVSAHQSRTNLS